jgi:proteic killer suppression protein
MIVLDTNSVLRYHGIYMIKTFSDPDAESLFYGQRPKRLLNQIWRIATRKLLILDGADTLEDLKVPPGNRLEKLKGDRVGQYSIRINDQWRICFVWREGNAHQVEITDYHQ